MNSLWRYEQDDYVSQFFQIHPENPQARLIKQAVEIIRKGGVVVYPTDSAYALGCQMGDKAAIERVRRLRGLDKTHNFTLMCCDLSQLGLYAKVDTGTFRLLKAHVPGPYTFILNGTREVPRLLLHDEASHHRPAGTGPCHHAGLAGRVGRAADEREPDPAGRQRADDRPSRNPCSGWSITSTW